MQELLDLKLEEAKKNKEELPPVAIINGSTGCGKTAIIQDWLKENSLDSFTIQAPGYHVVEKECKDGDIVQELLTKANIGFVVGDVSKCQNFKYDVLFSQASIDEMDKPNKVIVIDDYDWADYRVRKELMRLIRYSQVRKENGDIYSLKNILLLIIVVHPKCYGLAEEYDELEQQIFGKHS